MVPTPGELVQALSRAWALTEDTRSVSAADELAPAEEPDPLSLIEDGTWATAGRLSPTHARRR